MNTFRLRSAAVLLVGLLATPGGVAAQEQLDVRNAVPPSAYMAVYGQHNPERDYQREHVARAWQAVQDEKLPERILQIVLHRLPAEGQELVEGLLAEVGTILEPIDWAAMANCPAMVYGQTMVIPQTHHLLAFQLSSTEQAVALETAFRQLGEMIVRRTDGALQLSSLENGDAPVHSLILSGNAQTLFQPTLARYDDVVIFSSSSTLAHNSLDSLRQGGPSKFDDARLADALAHLPHPEDAVIFYSVKDQFDQMAGLADFIRNQAPDNEQALRMANLVEKVIQQLRILDYEATVVYTEGNRNLAATRGQLLPGAEETMLYHVLAEGAPFEAWNRWVPADATGFSLSTGVNLHALYEGVVGFLHREIPESVQPLAQFEQLQQGWGVHLDRDILQSFTGRCFSLTLPAATAGAPIGQDHVFALECTNPERIHQLISQGIDLLANQPMGKSQQLRLAPSEELEGFDELSANLLTGFQLRPVIGFHDGWLIVSTNLTAAKHVLETLEGAAPSINAAELFERFGLDVTGPVAAISFKDTSKSIHQAAQLIRQIGLFAPMAVASASAGANPDDVAPLLEALALLPSIANVVEKCDFYDEGLKVVVAGNTPQSYIKHKVDTIHPTED